MDSEKIIQDLNRRFAAPLPEFYKRRIVVWIDEDQEFVDKLDEITLGGAKVVALTGTNNFYVKKLLAVDDPTSNYLVYRPFAYESDEDNWLLDVELYGGSKVKAMATDKLLDWMDSIGCAMNDAMRKNGFYAPGSFRELMEKPKGIISLGAKMGEGWLLTAEMIELVEGGYENIVCAQPFGCLPNHIVGKGMINQIRARYPQANITPVDYDPSATRVNQENRIKLMLAVARERLAERQREDGGDPDTASTEEAVPV